MENKAFSAGDDDGEAQTKEIKFTTKQILMPCCWLSMCVLLLFYGPREPLHVPLPIPGPSSAVAVPSVRTATAKVTTTRLSWPCFARGFSLNEPSETSIPATKINSNHWHTHTRTVILFAVVWPRTPSVFVSLYTSIGTISSLSWLLLFKENYA